MITAWRWWGGAELLLNKRTQPIGELHLLTRVTGCAERIDEAPALTRLFVRLHTNLLESVSEEDVVTVMEIRRYKNSSTVLLAAGPEFISDLFTLMSLGEGGE